MSESALRRTPDLPAAVLFDLDGTLLDSLGSMATALGEVLASRGRATPAERVVAAFGLPLELEEVIARVGVPPEEAAEVEAAYRDLYYSSYVHLARPLPGAEDLIERLTGASVPLALITNRREESAHHALHARGWTEQFPVVVGSDTAEEMKPHPAPALYALAALGVAARQAAFVGDTAEDMACARDAGIATVVGLTHARSAGELRAAGATHVAADLAEVAALLGRPLPPEDDAR